MRTAKASDGNVRVAINRARHRRRPKALFTDGTVGVLVQLGEALQQACTIRVGRRHQLQQGLGIVRGDLRVGEWATQRTRVRCLRHMSLRRDAQGFLLDAFQAADQAPTFAGVHETGQLPIES